MTVLMLVSLLVIGAVTVFFFQSQNEIYHQERLARKERAIKTEMTYFSKEVEMQQGQNVVIKEFEQEVLRLSDVHNLEINIYNVEGQMLVSARPGEIHSEYIDRTVPQSALDRLKIQNRVILQEARDNNFYLSDYTVLKNSSGAPIAILNLPYKQDKTVSQKDLPEFLGSIGLTYFFLFIAAIGITVLLSNSITKDFSLLDEKLQTVDLNAHNETIPWSNDDEIGSLIRSYNDMLAKLSESRLLLAKTEREGAWREMARQVAHEIKNPLTPIKLSVQHLQATSQFDDDNWREKFKTTMAMIIQQIESLDRIASEFSDFAKIQQKNFEEFDLIDAVSDVVILFADSPVDIQTHIKDDKLKVFADPDAIRRVLNNLVKNAKQSLSETIDPKIIIHAQKVGGDAQISITDNGPGISDHVSTKIFQPNFTTKTSGAGLGLAICQQIIQQANGKIWFESTPNKLTTFYIQLPASKPSSSS